MASNPTTPAQASGPAFPPVATLPFIRIRANGDGYLTPEALQFLQYLFASLSGSGSIVDVSTLALSTFSGLDVLGKFDDLQKGYLDPIDFHDVSPSAISWTPLLIGDSTSGTQTYAIQWGQACYIGPLVLAQFSIVLTAKDAATAGSMLIAGLPMPIQTSARTQAGALSSYSNVTLPAGTTQLGIDAPAGTGSFALMASGSGVAAAPLTAAGVANNSTFKGSCCYFR